MIIYYLIILELIKPIKIENIISQYLLGYKKCCNTYLSLKSFWYKPYNNLQTLSVLSEYRKKLLIDFIISLPILPNCNNNNYDLIFGIINCLTKKVLNKLVKVRLNVINLTRVIINVISRYHGLLKIIISDRSLILISKF